MTNNFKKVVFVILLVFSFTFKVSAPTWESLIISYSSPIEPYKRLIYAIGMVETKCDTLAYNPIEEAYGYFQIRPIRLKDYNKRTGSNYTMRDLFNYKTSEKIFLYYAVQIGPYDFGRIARKWNGSGSNTIHYWNKIKKYI